MKIKLTEGVYWNTASNEQSEEARAWIRENVINGLGMSPDELGMILPELDQHRRPVRWVAEFDTFTVTVEREYVEPQGISWAMKADHISVTSKDE